MIKTVLARPYDDDDIVEVYQVEHENSERDFSKDWSKEKDKAREEHPEDWDINHILEGMESSKGWKITVSEIIEVTY